VLKRKEEFKNIKICRFRIFRFKILLLIFFNLSILNANIFIPQNNSNLNYRQIEFSWPQIPNSNNYKITINNINSDFSLLIDSDSNILIFNGNNLEWGESYSWQVCGYYDYNLKECHSEKYFNINSLPLLEGNDMIPAIIEVQYLDTNQVNNDLAIISGYFQTASCGIALDKEGSILWFSQHKQNFGFLPNGNFISRGETGLRELDINGNILFQSDDLGFHHHMSKTNHGTYFGLINSYEVHDCPEGLCSLFDLISNPNGIIWKGDKILELNSNGEIIWEWNTFDYIDVENYNSHYFNLQPWNDYMVDWTHSNEVFYNENDNAVYLSIRNLNTITKIDYDSKEVIWHLGDIDTFGDNSFFNSYPTFNHQHSPKILDNNHLLLFNNGTYNIPQVSSCQEYSINGNSLESIWEYILPDSLYTGARGECQRLDNGNTFIATGKSSNCLIINQYDDIVWHVVVKSESGLGQSSINRSFKVNSLFPSSFNIEFNNYLGTIESPYIAIYDNNLILNVINNGWMDDIYNVNINNENGFQYNDTIILNSNASHIMNVDIAEIMSNNTSNHIVDIEIYSNNKDISYNYSINLLFDESYGDLNNDGESNVVDVVNLVNWIFDSSPYNAIADMNSDGNVNVVDVVVLVNLILGVE